MIFHVEGKFVKTIKGIKFESDSMIEKYKDHNYLSYFTLLKLIFETGFKNLEQI